MTERGGLQRKGKSEGEKEREREREKGMHFLCEDQYTNIERVEKSFGKNVRTSFVSKKMD